MNILQTRARLVRHGQILREYLRREGIVSLRDVRYVLLEEDGHLSVIPSRTAAQ